MNMEEIIFLDLVRTHKCYGFMVPPHPARLKSVLANQPIIFGAIFGDSVTAEGFSKDWYVRNILSEVDCPLYVRVYKVTDPKRHMIIVSQVDENLVEFEPVVSFKFDVNSSHFDKEGKLIY